MSESRATNFVIAVSSVSGGGKTTLINKTAELLNGAVLLFDEYKTVSHYPKDVRKWLDDGADVNEWKTPQFARDVAALRSGESVTSPRDGRTVHPTEYIVIEDMKAAGFEPLEVHSGYTGNEMGAYVEFRDEKTTFFVRWLARGRHSVSYRLRAEVPGRFSALPAKAYAMYAPELRANSDEIKLNILDK